MLIALQQSFGVIPQQVLIANEEHRIAAPPTSPEESAARLALAFAWIAAADMQAIFAVPQFRWAGASEPQSAATAARYLAARGKPLWLAAVRHDAETVALVEHEVRNGALDPARNDPGLGRGSRARLSGLIRAGQAGTHALILAGGRVLRVGYDALTRLESEYWLEPVGPAAAGAPSDDWTQSLGLPPAWLESVGCVILLGRMHENGATMPLRAGEHWSAESFEDL